MSQSILPRPARPILTTTPRRCSLRAVGPAVLVSLLSVSSLSAQWPQFGGPHRNFQAPEAALGQQWPEDGPRLLWRRPLGEGTSSIAVVDGTLYTLYRNVGESIEVVAALEASDGTTLWEQSYPAPLWEGFQAVPSQGPHSTPLVVGDRLYTVGIRGMLKCWDRHDGELHWQKDLWKEYGSDPRVSGYSPSPLAWNDRLILPWGGEGHAVLALSLEDGREIWARHGFGASYASPLLIEMGESWQAVVLMAENVAGLDPRDGRLLWKHPHKNLHKVNASMPLWLPGNRLFVSSGYDGGSRMLQLRESEGGFEVEELWSTARLKVHHGSAVWLNGRIYASTGDVGPAFLAAVEPQTGRTEVRQRGFSKANFLVSGRKLIILDQDGELALAAPGGRRIEILSQAQVLTTLSWTAPSMQGTHLYLRDRREIAAFDLGR